MKTEEDNREHKIFYLDHLENKNLVNPELYK